MQVYDSDDNIIFSKGTSGNAPVSGTSALLADDNFIGGTTLDDISEISANNYSVGKIETGTVEIAQNDTLGAALAYTQDK